MGTVYVLNISDIQTIWKTMLLFCALQITANPPFSLFREFLAWIMEGGKQFIILGNINAITYKEVFPLLKNNDVWLGYKSLNQDMYFTVTDDYKLWLVYNKKEGSAYKTINGVVMGRLASACWFTNIDHGKRHEILPLDTMVHNLKFNKSFKKKLESLGITNYPKYDNYDAIEVPFTDCIPSDYEGIMGVPITFLDKYNPNQFEIVGGSMDYEHTECHIMKNYVELGYEFYKQNGEKSNSGALRDKMSPKIHAKGKGDYSMSPLGECLSAVYGRIFIRHKKGADTQ